MGYRNRVKDILKKPKPVDKTPLIEAIKDYILAGPGPMEELAGALGLTVVGLWDYIEDEWVRSSIRAFAEDADKALINQRMHDKIFKKERDVWQELRAS